MTELPVPRRNTVRKVPSPANYQTQKQIDGQINARVDAPTHLEVFVGDEVKAGVGHGWHAVARAFATVFVCFAALLGRGALGPGVNLFPLTAEVILCGSQAGQQGQRGRRRKLQHLRGGKRRQ